MEVEVGAEVGVVAVVATEVVATVVVGAVEVGMMVAAGGVPGAVAAEGEGGGWRRV